MSTGWLGDVGVTIGFSDGAREVGTPSCDEVSEGGPGGPGGSVGFSGGVVGFTTGGGGLSTGEGTVGVGEFTGSGRVGSAGVGFGPVKPSRLGRAIGGSKNPNKSSLQVAHAVSRAVTSAGIDNRGVHRNVDVTLLIGSTKQSLPVQMHFLIRSQSRFQFLRCKGLRRIKICIVDLCPYLSNILLVWPDFMLQKKLMPVKV